MRAPASMIAALTRLVFLVVLVGSFSNVSLAFAQTPEADQAREAYQQSKRLAAERRFDEALIAANKALRLTEQAFGASHPNTAAALDNLAMIYYARREFEEARALSERAVRIIDHLRLETRDAAVIYANLGTIYAGSGDYARAEPLQRRALKILRQVGASPKELGIALGNLATTLREIGQKQESRDLFAARADEVSKASGSESSDFGQALSDLAGAELDAGSTAKAKETLARADKILGLNGTAEGRARAALVASRIAVAEGRFDDALRAGETAAKQAPKLDAVVSSAAYERGRIHVLRGEFAEAREAFEAAVAAYRRLFGERHPAISKALNGLALALYGIGEFDAAERAFERAIKAQDEATPTAPWMSAAIRTSYAGMLVDLGRFEKGEKLLTSSLANYAAAPGDWSLLAGYTNSGLCYALVLQGRFAEANAVCEKAIALIEKARGPNSPDLPPGLTRLAQIRLEQRNSRAAIALAERAVAIRESDRARSPWGLGHSLAILSDAQLAAGDLDAALASSLRARDIVAHRLVGSSVQTDILRGEALRQRSIFESGLRAAFAGYEAGRSALISNIVELAQYPHLTDTASAIARMSARIGSGTGPLAQLVMERERIVRDLSGLRGQVQSALMSGQDGVDVEALRARAKEGADKLRQLDAQIRQADPKAALFLDPTPVALSDIMAKLDPDEAVFLTVASVNETFVICIRRDGARAVRAKGMGSKKLESLVSSMREGTDTHGASIATLKPFDVRAAYELYAALFEPFKRELAGLKHLIFIADGALQNFTPAALLTEPAPEPAEAYGRFVNENQDPKSFEPFARLRFLGWEKAFSILPNMSSLAALRAIRNVSPASERFVGFGAPNFDASPETLRARGAGDSAFRGPPLDARTLRTLFAKLPEAEDELRTIARELGAPASSVYIGADATTDRVLKTELDRYKVIAFATHGLVAGEFRGRVAEPALVMSPPNKPDFTLDDLLLKASTISGLKMNADWIILSACNTAAPSGRPGAEGLSGLSQAIFLAGSRAILVSHWPVESQAAASLTVTAMKAWEPNGKVSKSQAMMTAMVSYAKAGGYRSHPAYWAPFVVVGDGGR